MLFTEKTIGAFFKEQAARYGDRPFIRYPDRDLCFSWKEFEERARRLAKGLLALGLRPGDHLGVWARNVPDWLTFFFATAQVGIVLVTVNTSYKSHELAFVLKQSDMKALAIVDGFRDVNYLDIMYDLVPELRTRARGDLHSEAFPALRSVIFIGQEKHRGMYNTAELFQLGEHQNDTLLESYASTTYCDDVVNMQYTSGTTGFPKGVMLTHRNILNNGYYIGERQKLTDEDRVCLPVPLFHCFGIVLGVMACLTHGSTLVLLESFDPLLALAAVQKEKCTAIYGVPTMFIAELNHPMFNMFDLSSLRTGIMAGSPCPMERMKQVINDMHCPEITIAYGLTEASPVVTQTSTDDSLERRVSTVGRVLPGTEIKIVDPETGETLAPDQEGELCCRGYNIMKGYYNMPDATASVIDADGWLHTGDLATCDESGYYRITGRSKDTIIRGGENISPREIEEFLHSMPGIKDVQVAGVPDDRYGEVVGAFIIPADDADITESDVRDYAINRIARYKAPKHVFFVEDFPLTANGKIQKFKLRDFACEKLAIADTVFDKESASEKEQEPELV